MCTTVGVVHPSLRRRASHACPPTRTDRDGSWFTAIDNLRRAFREFAV
jgi:hypothetical protein